jgi:hypothetical protein
MTDKPDPTVGLRPDFRCSQCDTIILRHDEPMETLHLGCEADANCPILLLLEKIGYRKQTIQ